MAEHHRLNRLNHGLDVALPQRNRKRSHFRSGIECGLCFNADFGHAFNSYCYSANALSEKSLQTTWAILGYWILDDYRDVLRLGLFAFMAALASGIRTNIFSNFSMGIRPTVIPGEHKPTQKEFGASVHMPLPQVHLLTCARRWPGCLQTLLRFERTDWPVPPRVRAERFTGVLFCCRWRSEVIPLPSLRPAI